MKLKYARCTEHLKVSEIREFAKFLGQPGIISFAGGLPAPELFPLEELKKISVKVLDKYGPAALQYNNSEGFMPLRKQISRRLEKLNIRTQAVNIIITSGAQQGLDFCGKIFLDPEDFVLCESPTFLGAISAFKAYQSKFVELPIGEDGVNLDRVEHELKTNRMIKLIYVMPDFQNPTGKTWSLAKRRQLVEIANKYNTVIVEDNPYAELRFEGEDLPAIKSFDTEDRVIFLGSFSKIVCPGLRVAWICAGQDTLSKFVLAKQAADLHSNAMTQREIFLYLEEYDLKPRIEKMKITYKRRRDVMIDILKNEFPEEVKYTYPQGGIFIWVEFPEKINTRKLLEKALKDKVAFIPGGSFYPNGGHENSLRLNYSNMPEDKIITGMKILAKVVKNEIRQKS